MFEIKNHRAKLLIFIEHFYSTSKIKHKQVLPLVIKNIALQYFCNLYDKNNLAFQYFCNVDNIDYQHINYIKFEKHITSKTRLKIKNNKNYYEYRMRQYKKQQQLIKEDNKNPNFKIIFYVYFAEFLFKTTNILFKQEKRKQKEYLKTIKQQEKENQQNLKMIKQQEKENQHKKMMYLKEKQQENIIHRKEERKNQKEKQQEQIAYLKEIRKKQKNLRKEQKEQLKEETKKKKEKEPKNSHANFEKNRQIILSQHKLYDIQQNDELCEPTTESLEIQISELKSTEINSVAIKQICSQNETFTKLKFVLKEQCYSHTQMNTKLTAEQRQQFQKIMESENN